MMLLTLVAIWAIVLPVTILAVSWQAARLRDVRRLADRGPLGPPPGVASRIAARLRPRAARPRRTVTRRVCPEFPRSAGRRSASA